MKSWFQKLIISRDKTFKESALLHPKQKAIDFASSHAGDDLKNITNKLAFELEVLYASQQYVPILHHPHLRCPSPLYMTQMMLSFTCTKYIK